MLSQNRRSILIAATLSLITLSCSAPGSQATGDAGPSSSGTTPADAGAPDGGLGPDGGGNPDIMNPADAGSAGNTDDGPTILSFGTNVTSLSPGDSVTFVAVLTDSSGLSALAGGSLQSSDGGIQYGAFTAANQGSYSLTLSWDQVNQAQPLNFTGSTQRTFKAVFFDQQGKSSSRAVALTFSCPHSYAPDACAGTCTSLARDNQNCGTCGTVCQGLGLECNQARCGCANPNRTPCDSICVDLNNDPTNCGSCGHVCSGQTTVCGGGQCGCPFGTELCGSACVDTTTDVNNCGQCGATCAGSCYRSACYLFGGTCMLEPGTSNGPDPCSPQNYCFLGSYCSNDCNTDADCSKDASHTYACVQMAWKGSGTCAIVCQTNADCPANSNCVSEPDNGPSQPMVNVCD